ncbi:Hypothetical protein PHPALM_37654 [Phytophthora palmivora]|uniref:Transmembrane protein n=1 Tax=Phytophthora palmivora TaxID=4796 RepID=A0A2P4WWW3_9STRA|nr:Hypothetical protein PHPALM_37654 [Phytophthora palmivora]
MTSSSKVYPTAIATPSSFLVLLETLEQMLKAIGNYWKRIQVGHRGRYSVQRLLSFRDYYHCTSPGRVFLVCIMSLTPAFVVATLMECIPLKPPDAGWKANYTFWIRLFVSSLPVSFGAIFQFLSGESFLPQGSCACYVALTLAIAAGWKFPVPFGYVFTVPPFVSFYMILLVLSIDPRVLARSPVLRQQLFSQLLGIAAQAVLAIAYPLFSAVFNQLSGNQQTAFIFVLPILKFCIKQVIAKTSAHLHECVDSNFSTHDYADDNNRIFTPETRNAIERRNFASVVKTSNRKTTITQAGHSTAVEEAQDALQVLFHCEYVVMAEFIEFAIPMLYTIYLTILYRLPTAAYYPHTRSLTPEKFANTQCINSHSFLETQVAILQGHYFLWISWILQITLEHNGVDLNAPFT